MGDTQPGGQPRPFDDAPREHLAALIDALPGGVLIRDLEGRVSFVNRWLPEYLGRRHDEVEGTVIGEPYQLVDERGVELDADAYPSARAARGEHFDSIVVGVPGAEGTIRWVATSGRPVTDERGRIVGGLIVFLDTTEQVHLRQQLLRRDALLHEAERISGVGSWARDVASGDTEVSAQFRRLVGMDPDEPVTREVLYEFIHPDDRTQLFEGTYRAFVEGRGYAAQLRAVERSGAERRIEVRAERYAGPDGSPAGLVGTVRDLTAQAERDEHLVRADRMEIVGRLAGGLAHDFNNLLTVLTGHADLLQASSSPQQLESIEAIRAATERAQRMTEQLLEFSRRQVLQPQAVDVRQLIDQVHAMARSVVPANIELRVEHAAEALHAHVDPTKLEQVLLNLMLNARDALEDGGRITVRTGVVHVADDLPLPAGRFVQVEVVDNGPGMGPDVLDHAFDPFFTTKAAGEGTGLGLATSYGLVTQSGGTLTLESAPGRGTTARVLLPSIDPPTSPPEEVAAPTTTAATDSSATILLAEDDDQLRPLLERVLASTGHHVLVGVDGLDAFEVAARSGRPIDLLVTDVTMPRRNGHDLAVALGAVHPGLRVLFMSGYTEHAELVRSIADGNVDFLAKPFSPAALLELVRDVMGRHPGIDTAP